MDYMLTIFDEFSTNVVVGESTGNLGLWDAAEIEHEIKLNKTRVQCYKEFKEFRRRHVSLPTAKSGILQEKKSDSILHFICLLMQVYSKIELEVGCSCVVASFYRLVSQTF